LVYLLLLYLFIFQAKKYQIDNKFLVLYGISQNPDTNDYILVSNWTSGNEKIDGFIQKKQLIINKYNDAVFEWIPYNQFNEIKKTGKSDLITAYSAIWKDGPLYKKDKWGMNYARNSNKEVALKCLHNSKDLTEFVIDEV
jgi:hypothetical protein